MAAQTLSVLALSTTNPSHSTNLKPSQFSSLALPRNLRPNGLGNSFLGEKLYLSSSNLCSIVHKRQWSTVKVFLSLPTANPERFANGKMPQWSARAIKSFGMAEVSARKLRYGQIGTECLLMGILVEGTSEAAKFLRANGMTIFNVRAEALKILGKSDITNRCLRDVSLTKPALRALDWALEEKLKSGESGEVTTTHMLLGIWAQKGYAGHRILAAFGFDDEKAKELAKLMDMDVVLSYR